MSIPTSDFPVADSSDRENEKRYLFPKEIEDLGEVEKLLLLLLRKRGTQLTFDQIVRSTKTSTISKRQIEQGLMSLVYRERKVETNVEDSDYWEIRDALFWSSAGAPH